MDPGIWRFAGAEISGDAGTPVSRKRSGEHHDLDLAVAIISEIGYNCVKMRLEVFNMGDKSPKNKEKKKKKAEKKVTAPIASILTAVKPK